LALVLVVFCVWSRSDTPDRTSFADAGATGILPVHWRDASGTPADPADKNPLAGCTMCHIDVEDEFVGGVHYKEKVACVKCHGKSEGHVADENNEVKPEELFARKDVDRLCGVCHECPRPEEAKPAAEPPRKVCTECHGAHEFPVAAKEGHDAGSDGR
jgi:hypothetical protein